MPCHQNGRDIIVPRFHFYRTSGIKHYGNSGIECCDTPDKFHFIFRKSKRTVKALAFRIAVKTCTQHYIIGSL